MLVTPLRDGMNLVAKEYAASRVDGGGVLVLSEFAGAADELCDALLVNPHDREAVQRAMVDAASMDPDEARARMASIRAGRAGQRRDALGPRLPQPARPGPRGVAGRSGLATGERHQPLERRRRRRRRLGPRPGPKPFWSRNVPSEGQFRDQKPQGGAGPAGGDDGLPPHRDMRGRSWAGAPDLVVRARDPLVTVPGWPSRPLPTSHPTRAPAALVDRDGLDRLAAADRFSGVVRIDQRRRGRAGRRLRHGAPGLGHPEHHRHPVRAGQRLEGLHRARRRLADRGRGADAGHGGSIGPRTRPPADRRAGDRRSPDGPPLGHRGLPGRERGPASCRTT